VTTLVARGLRVQRAGRALLDGVDVTVAPGQWLTVVGPNGAGKSTLVRALAGLVAAEGTIEIDGRPTDRLARRHWARAVAVVPQVPVVPPGASVFDYVLLGRTPHLGRLAKEGPHDVAVVHAVLAELELVMMADRDLHTLSGGERQRVFVARALAQEAPVLLLDEPTTSLDVGHQLDVLECVDRLRVTRRLAVLSTMHDLTLAGRYAHRLVLLHDGRVVAEGDPATVLTEENLARYYGAPVRVLDDGQGVVVVPQRTNP
jgi:iron complex transport system ATP-binding protein